MKVIYWVSGPSRFFREFHNSYNSFREYVSNSDVIVYTDQSQGIEVDVEIVDISEKNWGLGFNVRWTKINVVSDAKERFPNEDLIIVDTDTELLKDPSPMFDAISDGSYFLHKFEYQLSDIERYMPFVNFFLADVKQYNSGVIGLPADSSFEVEEWKNLTLKLNNFCKSVPHLQGTLITDQLALSVLLQDKGIKTCEDIIHHYWYNTRRRYSEKIYLAVPTMGKLRTQLHMRILQWVQQYNIFHRAPERLQPVSYARNWIADDFLKSDCDVLLSIDADMSPPLQIIPYCLDAEVDIITPVTRTMKRDSDGILKPAQMTLRMEEDGLHEYQGKKSRGIDIAQGNEVEEIDAAGHACMMIRRRVFETIEPPWYELGNWKERPSRGEDFNFCAKAQRAGFKIHAHFGLKCVHWKECPI